MKRHITNESLEELFDLALSYEYGTEKIAVNKRKAISIYRKLANVGHVDAQYRLSLHYSIGECTIENKHLARFWLKKAAKNGLADAQFRMARELLMSRKDNNDRRIFEWTKRAALQGHVEALSYLAFCYEMGFHVEQDEETAAQIYRLLAERDNLDGIYHLGRCYQYGSGVEKDTTEAERLYQRAIELGDPRAEIQLFHMRSPQEMPEDDEYDNYEQESLKYPIGKCLKWALFIMALLSILFSILAALCFDSTLLEVYAGYKYTLFDGLYYKWPIIFWVLALVCIYAMVTTGTISLCKREFEDHILMRAHVFKQMLPAIISLMLFVIPTLSRYTMGLSEYDLETGCIIGYAEPYHNLYSCFELIGFVSATVLVILQLSRDSGSKRLKNAFRIFYMCMSIFSSCGMAFLNLRIQFWLIIPYIFVCMSLAGASVIILRRMHAAAIGRI